MLYQLLFSTLDRVDAKILLPLIPDTQLNTILSRSDPCIFTQSSISVYSPISHLLGLQNRHFPSDFPIQVVLVHASPSTKASSLPRNMSPDVTVHALSSGSVSQTFLLVAPSELDLSLCPLPLLFVEAVTYEKKLLHFHIVDSYIIAVMGKLF